jgi:hypothetical protein
LVPNAIKLFKGFFGASMVRPMLWVPNIGALVGASLLALTQASAQDMEKNRRALNEVHHEMVTCVAFHQIMHRCISNRQRPNEDAVTLQRTAATIDHLVKEAVSVAQAIGMTPDAMQSRMVMEMGSMMSMMNNDCVNTSSVLARHGHRCKQVVENPDSVLREYMRER